MVSPHDRESEPSLPVDTACGPCRSRWHLAQTGPIPAPEDADVLLVRVDLLPYGLLPPERIAVIEIANDGTGSAEWGGYCYRVGMVDRRGRLRYGRWYRHRRHRRRDGALVLLEAVLRRHLEGPRERSDRSVRLRAAALAVGGQPATGTDGGRDRDG